MNEKLLKIFGGVIAGFVVLILILLLISSCTKREYTFEKLEKEMTNIAKNYYEKHKNELPKANEEVTYTLDDMIKDGKLAKLSELFNDDTVKCTGDVSVLNNEGEYIYTPYLDCNEKYITPLLSDMIIQNSTVSNGIGLYKVGQQYIMKGEVKDNYLKMNGKMYRIIRINEDGSIKIMEDETTINTVWDNRYDSEIKANTGFNQYILLNNISSRIKEKLETHYNNEKNYPKEIRKYLIAQDACVGERTLEDSTSDGSTECSVIVGDQHITTISAYEFLAASLDINCNRTDARACKNFNWMSKLGYTAWTITPYAGTNNMVYVFDLYLEEENCNTSTLVYPVFTLYSRVKYLKGDGTKDSPYIIFESEKDK